MIMRSAGELLASNLHSMSEGRKDMQRDRFVFAGVIAASLWLAVPSSPGRPQGRRAPITSPALASGAPVCSGEYADEATALRASVRDYERDPENKYSYCLRTSAVYECLSYGSDGAVRKTRKTTVAHGTGFAWRRSGGETFLLTNDHVASWTPVTDPRHEVDDVPSGCKLVGESVKIVDDEEDDYEPNDVQLTRVVSDPALDVTVLKTRAPLKVIPYRVGRSSALHVGNVVSVHGYPLGAFAATNTGKVVNAYDHDTDKDWDHVDFVVDALLSPGSSGSPVLAVSCKTGEYELVGIYHAGYVRGSALNVVVGIDQVKDLMTTFKRTPRVADTSRAALGPDDRHAIERAIATSGAPPFFPFPLGPLVASARRGSSGALVFEIYTKAFPMSDDRLLIVEDLPPLCKRTGARPPGAQDDESSFGRLGRIYVGNARGLREVDRSALDGDAQAQLERIVRRLRASAAATARWREADGTTSKGHKKRRAIQQALSRQGDADRDAAQGLQDLAEHLGPRVPDHDIAIREVLPPLPASAEAPECTSPGATAAAPARSVDPR